MKRIALLVIGVFAAVALFACGDKAEKKVETTTTTTEQSQPAEMSKPAEATTPAETTPAQ